MQTIQNTISETIRSIYGIEFNPDISPAPKSELGEYCIGVFQLAKLLGKAPNIIAEEVATELAKRTDTFISTNSIGGYVNFFLTDEVWLSLFFDLNQPTNPPTHQQTIVVDYIGANVGKPLHIGHICTPSIGQVICNTYRHLGYRVIGDSHFGDWGGIFGAIIYSWKFETDIWNDQLQKKYDFLECKDENDKRNLTSKNPERFEILNKLLENEWINYILYLYKKFHSTGPATLVIGNELDRIRQQDLRDSQARKEFKKLSEWDTENAELWKKFTSISITETEKKLKLLNVKATYNIGESFYEGLDLPRPNNEDYPNLEFTMKDIIRELVEKWIATQNDDGSVGVIFPEEAKMPSCILQKKDGTGLYLTSDLAAIKYRLTNGWNPSKIIYSVDVRQQLHLKQAFWIAREAWWEELGANDVEFFHAFNGFIKLKEWAMSTRHGTVIFLEKLIEEGFERTEKVLTEKWRIGDNSLKKDDIQGITIGAIKYSYLAQDREKDVTFDWDKALNFDGNSGPYIQYSYVRGKKIISQWFTQKQISSGFKLATYDKSLIQAIARMDGVVLETATKYKPHILALYCYDLAVAFNSFYVHTPKILEEKDENLKDFRLGLCQIFTEKIALGFELLGINMPSEM